VTLYQAVSKRLPYARGRHDAAGEDRFPQLTKEAAELDPIRHSPGLAEAVMSTLRRDPNARPSVTELFDRFDELAAMAGVGKVRVR
jgi:hypothetical protein